jgi:RNA 2',3'-cyclic 3'-phosphodiesterase
MRVFLACRLGRDAAVDLHETLQPLQHAPGAARLRWVAPQNYHVTLRFFGTLSAPAVAEICELIEPIAGQRRPIGCRVAAPRAFPSWSRPAVLALVVDSGGALERLAQACDAVIAPRFGAPDHPFRAHLTVARCRRIRRLTPPVAPLSFEFDMTSCGVYRSRLAAGGAHYDAICEFAFAGAT